MRLTDKYGKGWSVATLKNAKKFYNVYSEKTNSVYSIDNKKAKHCLANSKCETASLNVNKDENTPISPFMLSWSHYLVLMRIMLQPTNSIFPTRPCCKPRLKNGLRSLKKMRS